MGPGLGSGSIYGNVIPSSSRALEVTSGVWVKYLVEVNKAGGE